MVIVLLQNSKENKRRVYLLTPVFREIANHPLVSIENKSKILELWKFLNENTILRISDKRFPTKEEIMNTINEFKPNIIGCHLSHRISKDMLTDSNIFAVCTSTAGYNHIDIIEDVLITHTPGVLHKTVADFTIAIILANLRNLIKLHNFVWNEQWNEDQKWDLDQELNSTIDSKILGIVGLGEIGREIVKKLAPWGIKIKYYDIIRQNDFENKYNIEFIATLEEIFESCDIISLHIPLIPKTHHLIGEELLKKMKKGTLLVNTARGSIIDFKALLKLLENGEISINLAFDVYENEPILKEELERFKKIQQKFPELRFLFIPHNASADANTRAQMAIMILEDIINLAISKKPEDLKNIRLIPEQRHILKHENFKELEKFRISKFWIF